MSLVCRTPQPYADRCQSRDKCGPRLDAVPTWSDAAALSDDACAPNTHNAVQHFVSGRDQVRPLQEADHHRRITVYRRCRCALRPLDGGGAIQIPLIRVRSMRCDFRLCEGFRTPAVTNVSTGSAAGVRKPPRDETAGRGTYWAVPRAQLWGFGRGRATAEVGSEVG